MRTRRTAGWLVLASLVCVPACEQSVQIPQEARGAQATYAVQGAKCSDQPIYLDFIGERATVCVQPTEQIPASAPAGYFCAKHFTGVLLDAAVMAFDDAQWLATILQGLYPQTGHLYAIAAATLLNGKLADGTASAWTNEQKAIATAAAKVFAASTTYLVSSTKVKAVAACPNLEVLMSAAREQLSEALGDAGLATVLSLVDSNHAACIFLDELFLGPIPAEPAAESKPGAESPSNEPAPYTLITTEI